MRCSSDSATQFEPAIAIAKRADQPFQLQLLLNQQAAVEQRRHVRGEILDAHRHNVRIRAAEKREEAHLRQRLQLAKAEEALASAVEESRLVREDARAIGAQEREARAARAAVHRRQQQELQARQTIRLSKKKQLQVQRKVDAVEAKRMAVATGLFEEHRERRRALEKESRAFWFERAKADKERAVQRPPPPKRACSAPPTSDPSSTSQRRTAALSAGSAGAGAKAAALLRTHICPGAPANVLSSYSVATDREAFTGAVQRNAAITKPSDVTPLESSVLRVAASTSTVGCPQPQQPQTAPGSPTVVELLREFQRKGLDRADLAHQAQAALAHAEQEYVVAHAREQTYEQRIAERSRIIKTKIAESAREKRAAVAKRWIRWEGEDTKDVGDGSAASSPQRPRPVQVKGRRLTPAEQERQAAYDAYVARTQRLHAPRLTAPMEMRLKSLAAAEARREAGALRARQMRDEVAEAVAGRTNASLDAATSKYQQRYLDAQRRAETRAACSASRIARAESMLSARESAGLERSTRISVAVAEHRHRAQRRDELAAAALEEHTLDRMQGVVSRLAINMM